MGDDVENNYAQMAKKLPHIEGEAGMNEPRNFRPPNVGMVIPLIGSAILVSLVDITKMNGTFTIYETEVDARKAQHNFSLEQHPEWHAENCKFCKTGWGL